MILERYSSYIKNYQRDDGSAFMKNVYNPSAKETDKTPDEDEKIEKWRGVRELHPATWI